MSKDIIEQLEKEILSIKESFDNKDINQLSIRISNLLWFIRKLK